MVRSGDTLADRLACAFLAPSERANGMKTDFAEKCKPGLVKQDMCVGARVVAAM
jgi:hypothetical protein